jgi:3',5'-cyclic AMP phosphodiesterase CpdA
VFRLAHISDLHLLSLRGTTALSFVNKRVTGGVNLLLRRAHTHRLELVELALADLARADVDHLVVTGDLSNLSLPSEFELAHTLLRGFGDHRRVSVIPGNHDRYTYWSERRGEFERQFADLLTSDLPELARHRCYPWVKLFDEVALIGLSSAIATPPGFATGRVSRAQLEGLADALRHRQVRERFKVVLVHHHLFKPAHKRFNRLRRLVNGDALLEVLLRGRANLLLHGHNHRHAFHEVPHRAGAGVLRISEVGSTSAAHPEDAERAGKFNLYEIEGGRLTALRAFVHEEAGHSPGGRFREWKTIEPTT